MKKSCLIIAGEKSGEDHLQSFFGDLREKTQDFEYFGVGGDYLESQGTDLLFHLREFSNVGFTEVIGKLLFYKKAMKQIIDEVQRRDCRHAILVDFQTFNIQLLQKLKKIGVEVYYYVAPQAWAWKSWRGRILAENAHTLFTLLPFEKKWFADRGVHKVFSVKHPALINWQSDLKEQQPRSFPGELKNILILPGSRDIEVRNLLPVYHQVVQLLKKEYRIRVTMVKSSSVREKYYDYFEDMFDEIYPSEKLGQALLSADVALAASGTVTLICAMFGLPTVVNYKVDLFNEFMARTFIKYKGPISLANITLQDFVLPELFQQDAQPAIIFTYVKEWLNNEKKYLDMVQKLQVTKVLLQGDDIDVAHYIAKHMIK